MDWNKKVYPKDLWNKFKSILPKRTGSKYVRINPFMHKKRSIMSMFWADFSKVNRDIWKYLISFISTRRPQPTYKYTQNESPIRSGRPIYPPPSPRARKTYKAILEDIEAEKNLDKEIDDLLENILGKQDEKKHSMFNMISKERNAKKLSITEIINRRRNAILDDIWGSAEIHGIFDSQKDYPITLPKPKE